MSNSIPGMELQESIFNSPICSLNTSYSQKNPEHEGEKKMMEEDKRDERNKSIYGAL